MKTLLMGAAVLAFAACGTSDSKDPTDPTDPSNPTDPTNPDDPDDPVDTARDIDGLAAVLGAHVRGEFALQLAAAEISRGRTVEGFALTSVAVEGSTGTGSVGSMSYDFTVRCEDAQIPHQPQPCDGSAYHSHFKITATGSQSIGAMSMSGITRVVDWEIRDIALGKARFMGPDDVVVTSQVDGAKYELSFDGTYTSVRYLANQSLPTFGTIDLTINVKRTRDGKVREFAATAKITYADGPATIAIDASSYAIDMNSGAVTKI